MTCPRCPNRLRRESDRYGVYLACICGYTRELVSGPPVTDLERPNDPLHKVSPPGPPIAAFRPCEPNGRSCGVCGAALLGKRKSWCGSACRNTARRVAWQGQGQGVRQAG